MSTETITKDMTIGTVVQNYPQVTETLLSFGVHCVGCHVAHWETLEEGFKTHGMSDEEVDSAVIELNKAVKDDGSIEGILVTEKAASKLKELMAKEKKPGHALRISLVQGGCSGFKYGFEFEKQPAKDDTVVEVQGVKVVVAKQDWNFLQGCKVDYVESLEGSGFRVVNHKATAGCGCGQSFTI